MAAKKNKAYWKDRLIDNAQKAYDITEAQMIDEMKKLYSDLSKKMKQEIGTIYVKMVEDEITKTDIWTYRRYRNLSKQLSVLAARLGMQEEAIFDKYLEEALRKIYKETYLPNTAFEMIDETMVKQIIARTWSEKDFSESIWDNKAAMVDQLKKSITEAAVLGKSKDKAIKEIMKKLDSTYNNTARLVRTELMHTINEGQRQRYLQGGYTKLEIIATKGERTCKICGARHGTHIGINDGGAYPPFHPNCRCTCVPVLNK